ncbi:MAG: Pyrrolo-quinoline quinone repeat-containing protein, partial [Gemmatimonadetes bacterium]|nr:Pyrrolo-quinoline quinone repeat-containing protein [Gemmatimonadota bacterium]
NCVSCHRANRRGDGGRVPSLVGVETRLSVDQILQIIAHGRGFMPAQPALPVQQQRAVVDYLLGRSATTAQTVKPKASSHAAELVASRTRRSMSPYEFVGYERWKDPDGYPALKPPWGTLNAIDLNTGEYRWRIPLGNHVEIAKPGAPPTGTEQYGGPIVTAGGLVFIAATKDEKIRAFDKSTGDLLWEAPLPAAGYATPSTYMLGGRQYVVIAAGGGKIGSKSADAYVAFAVQQ